MHRTRAESRSFYRDRNPGKASGIGEEKEARDIRDISLCNEIGVACALYLLLLQDSGHKPRFRPDGNWAVPDRMAQALARGNPPLSVQAQRGAYRSMEVASAMAPAPAG